VRYSQIAKDISWWHNERASISILACAAARLENWVALEEFPTRKGKVEQDGDRREQQGRCDLWLAHRQRDYAIEFKQAWQSLDSRVRDFVRTQQAWEAAWKACGNLQADEAERRFSGIFVSPYHKGKAKEIDGSHLRRRFIQLEEWMVELEGIVALAWTYRLDLAACESSKHYVFPGALVALRRRHRSEKTRHLRS